MGGFIFQQMAGFINEQLNLLGKTPKAFNPDYYYPVHCPGWKATNRIIDTMPDKFIQSSVGTTFQFFRITSVKHAKGLSTSSSE